MLNYTCFIFSFCALLLTGTLAAQVDDGPIVLKNPSFEDYPSAAKVVNGWYDCGERFFPRESAPDIHPSPNLSKGFFGVLERANDGNTYVGMVARENDTNESMSQRLSAALVGGSCYNFSIQLMKSSNYKSSVRINGKTDEEGELRDFTTPIVLRIWGGNTYCDKAELLGESAKVSNTDWKQFDFKFEPTSTYRYIMLEAFYKTPTLFPYNGNILIDNASAIVLIDCANDKPLIAMNDVQEDPPKKVNQKPTKVVKPKPKPAAKPKEKPVNNKPKLEPKVNNPIAQTEVKPKSKVAKKLIGIDRNKIKKGQTIRMDKLYFKSDSFNITQSNYPILDEVYEFLIENNDVSIEVGGHTNGKPSHDFCDNLSSKRAKAVHDYLRKKGIPERRLSYKGYGKRNPIASNKTVSGRKKNQRVEVKILEISG